MAHSGWRGHENFGAGWRGAGSYKSPYSYQPSYSPPARTPSPPRTVKPIRKEVKVVDMSAVLWCPKGTHPYGNGHPFPASDPDKKRLSEEVKKRNPRTGDILTDEYGDDRTETHTYVLCGFHAASGMFQGPSAAEVGTVPAPKD